MVLRISSGGRPKRPKNPIMTDELWKLTQRCLEQDPQRRPEIADVVRCLRKTLTVRRDRVCSTNGIINNQSGESLAGHDVIESKGSWSSLHNDGGQNPPAAPRNLLQRAYSALFSCGKPSAHDYKDSIPVLLTGYNTTGILDASKGRKPCNSKFIKANTSRSLQEPIVWWVTCMIRVHSQPIPIW